MTNRSIIELPTASFVETQLTTLRNPQLEWICKDNAHLLPAELACMPMADEPGYIYNNNRLVSGYAEIYGGAGVGANAGGVRCANLDQCQIKGIGPTTLAGRSTDKWHRHGACSIQDAVKETIFSELFHHATPYGSARAVAVISIGASFATEIGADKLPGSAPRALFVREKIVRLAHFMRSSFIDSNSPLRVQELTRMRICVPLLVDYLCEDSNEKNFENASKGIEKIFWRIFQQTIAMRIGRLVHGSMIPSNFGLDGRLLDFTTSTAISTLQPVVVTLGSACSQTQHKQVADSLFDVLFYISKFDSRCGVEKSFLDKTHRQIVEKLNSNYNSEILLSHLYLIGLNNQEITKISGAASRRLVRAIVNIVLHGSTEGHLYYGGDEHPMLPATGKNALGAVLILTVSGTTGLEWESHREIYDSFSKASLDELRESYSSVVAELIAIGSDKKSLKLAHLVRSLKINFDFSELYRRNIDGKINDVCTKGGNIREFIDSVLSACVNLVSWFGRDQVFLNGWLTNSDYLLRLNNSVTLDGREVLFAEVVDDIVSDRFFSQYPWFLKKLRDAQAN